jgi:hypothetical protein
LKNREDKLVNTINELEIKKNVILKARLKEIISTSDVSVQRSNIANNHQNENNELHHFHPKVEPSSRKLIFDTKDFFQ